MRGGMEAIYDDVNAGIGFSHFAPTQAAHGPMFNARRRLGLKGESALKSPVDEGQIDGK